MAQSKVLAEAYSFTPSSPIELWTLDGTAIGLSTIYRFVNCSDGLFQPVTFNGVQYTPFPILADGFELDGKSSLPRPKLSVSNANGFVSNLLLCNGRNLDGATVTRLRVHARFLDSSNWPAGARPPWNTPDPSASYAPEPFTILRKVTENPQAVTWELASGLETQGARLPKNTVVANACVNFKYRDPRTCRYSGAPVADIANRPFTGSIYGMTLTDQGVYSAATTYNRGDYVTYYSLLPQFASIPTVWVCQLDGTVGVTPASTSPAWVADACAKSVAACKLRFPTSPLRTSAFPGAARFGWVSRA